jgi:hypothetical protein
MILSLVPLTPAAAPPNRLQGCVFTREFPLRIKRRRPAPITRLIDPHRNGLTKAAGEQRHCGAGTSSNQNDLMITWSSGNAAWSRARSIASAGLWRNSAPTRRRCGGIGYWERAPRTEFIPLNVLLEEGSLVSRPADWLQASWGIDVLTAGRRS